MGFIERRGSSGDAGLGVCEVGISPDPSQVSVSGRAQEEICLSFARIFTLLSAVQGHVLIERTVNGPLSERRE